MDPHVYRRVLTPGCLDTSPVVRPAVATHVAPVYAYPLMSTVLGRALRPHYDTGASFGRRALWYFTNLAVLHNPWLPLSAPRVWALRLFGARVGKGVTIKPQVKVKFPWKLVVGDGAAIGEECWIDNLDQVTLGKGAVLSQRTYLCTGNHDWRSLELPLTTAPIHVGEHAWVGAGVVVAPGASVGDRTVVALGSVVVGELPADRVCAGRPAVPIKARAPEGARPERRRRRQTTARSAAKATTDAAAVTTS